MLRLILAGHSRLMIPPETWFLLSLVNKVPLTAPLSAEEVQVAAKTMLECHRWPDMAITEEEFMRHVCALQQPALRDIVEIVYRVHLDRAGKQRPGDKTPTYINIVPELKKIFPDAKFIHLIRDGRDVAMSFVDANFWDRPYNGAAFEWTKAIRKGQAYRQTGLAKDILEVRYETLVVEPEQTVRGICMFLGESFEPSMMNFNQRVKLVPERERRIHTKLGEPILNNATEIWRRKLSALECFVIEASLRRELLTLGYPLRFANPGWRPMQESLRWVLEALAPLLDRAIPALRRRGIIARRGYI
jgi:hypothetical protein